MRRLVTCALTLAWALPVAGNVEAATTENAHARSTASANTATGQDPIVPLPFAPFAVSQTTISVRQTAGNAAGTTSNISARGAGNRSPERVAAVNVASSTSAKAGTNTTQAAELAADPATTVSTPAAAVSTAAVASAVTTPASVAFDITKVAATPASPFSDLLMWGVPAEQPAEKTGNGVRVSRVHAPVAMVNGSSPVRVASQGLAGLTESILSKTRMIASRITANAMHYIGTPYVFGGTSASGFDCSGYVQRIFAMVGVFLPRTADAQYAAGHHVDLAHAKRGDLVFFTTYAAGASHVGIYLGNNEFIHSSSSRGVTVSSLNESYWAARFIGAERVLSSDKVAAATVETATVAANDSTPARN